MVPKIDITQLPTVSEEDRRRLGKCVVCVLPGGTELTQERWDEIWTTFVARGRTMLTETEINAILREG